MIGSLTLDQLRVLVTIADTGSFTAAGRKLGRAQSAISQAIATLEGIQSVVLFDRSRHKPRLTEAGRVLVDMARQVLASAGRFEGAASGMRAGLEPELTIAIDPLVPTAPLIDKLRSLEEKFPDLPVSFSTEGLGGSLRRLRSGAAAIGICLLLPVVPDDVIATPLFRIGLRPVVAPGHPLALLGRPATQSDLAPYVQLVLSDPVAPDAPNFGVIGTRLWRFVDLGRRLDFVMAGFGWCRMPAHLVDQLIDTGQLKELVIADDSEPRDGLTIYAAHLRNRPPGPAGQWLLDQLRAIP